MIHKMIEKLDEKIKWFCLNCKDDVELFFENKKKSVNNEGLQNENTDAENDNGHDDTMSEDENNGNCDERSTNLAQKDYANGYHEILKKKEDELEELLKNDERFKWAFNLQREVLQLESKYEIDKVEQKLAKMKSSIMNLEMDFKELGKNRNIGSTYSGSVYKKPESKINKENNVVIYNQNECHSDSIE